MTGKLLVKFLIGMLLSGVLIVTPTMLLAQDDLVQQEKLEFEDITVTLMLPDGWLIMSLGENAYLFGPDSDSLDMILVGIDQVFDNIASALEPGGEQQATPTPIPFNELVVGMVGASNKAYLGLEGLSVVDFVNESLGSPGSPFLIDQLEETQFNDWPAVIVPMLLDLSEEESEAIPENISPTGLVAVIDMDSFFVTFMGMALAETDQSALFEAILQTFEVSDSPEPLALVQLPETQTGDSFLDMMALIPASSYENQDEWTPLTISYIDFRAVEQARPGTVTPQSWQEWNNLRDTDPLSGLLWQANSYRIQSGPGALISSFGLLETMPTVMGFDLFDIDRALTFGQLPKRGDIYAGDFDPEAVAQAHLARDYTETDLGGISLWCGPVGCENGGEQDSANRDYANIFGGDRGRQFPFLVLPQHLATSMDLPLVTAMADTYQGEALSLLDVPAYRAGAEAIAQTDDLLVQAQFYPAVEFGILHLDWLGDLADQGNEIVGGYGTLPVYELAILADFQDGEDQVAMIALVYAGEQDARTGADELSNRLASYPDMRGEQVDLSQPVLERDDINGRMGEPMVYYSEAGNKWVTMAVALYPLPPTSTITQDTRPVDIPAGVLFRIWVSDLWQRKFMPLVFESVQRP
jgi:hypothetical protein